MIRTIFFDFDGVLTDSAEGFTVIAKAIHKYVPNKTYEEVVACYDQPFRKEMKVGKLKHTDFWNEVCQCLGQNIPVDKLEEIFIQTLKNNDMFKLAQDLKKNYKLGIITDNGDERIDALTKAWDLPALFDTIVTSGEAGALKPSKEIFEYALNKASAKAEESVFIDNREENLDIPAEMGFKTFFYDFDKADINPLINQLQQWQITLE